MTKKVKSKVLEIMALALEFNGKPTKQELTGNKPTIFVDFAGHVCELDVGISMDGWSFSANKAVKLIYLDRQSAAKELDKTLKTLKAVIAEYEERENR